MKRITIEVMERTYELLVQMTTHMGESPESYAGVMIDDYIIDNYQAWMDSVEAGDYCDHSGDVPNLLKNE